MADKISSTHSPPKDTIHTSHVPPEVERRHYRAAVALDLVKTIMREGCRIGRYKDGAFAELDFGNLELALQTIVESPAVTGEDSTLFRDTRSKVGHLKAFRMGCDTVMDSVTDLSWVTVLKSFFDQDEVHHSEGAKAPIPQKQTDNSSKKKRLLGEDDGLDDVPLTRRGELDDDFGFVALFKRHLAGW